MGVVLSLCELRPEASPAQQVLSDSGQPGLPHLCVRAVLSHLVLHQHCGGAGTHSAKQGTLDYPESQLLLESPSRNMSYFSIFL